MKQVNQQDENPLHSYPPPRPEVSGTVKGALPHWLERRLEESEADYQAGQLVEWEEVKRASDLKYGHV